MSTDRDIGALSHNIKFDGHSDLGGRSKGGLQLSTSLTRGSRSQPRSSRPRLIHLRHLLQRRRPCFQYQEPVSARGDRIYFVPPPLATSSRSDGLRVVLSTDVFVDRRGLTYVADSNARLDILEFTGTA